MDDATFFYTSSYFGKTESRPQTTLELDDESKPDHNAKYAGEWLEGTETRQGKGTLERSNGEKYEGYFKNNQFSGKGRFTFAEGDSQDRK